MSFEVQVFAEVSVIVKIPKTTISWDQDLDFQKPFPGTLHGSNKSYVIAKIESVHCTV